MSDPIDMRSIYDALDAESQDNDRYSMREYAAAALSGLLSRLDLTSSDADGVVGVAWDFAEAMYVEEKKRFEKKG